MRDMPNLDFLRAVAVSTVVAEHTALALGIQRVGPFEVQYFGVLGVLVFFVLTSLVLMWSLERRPHTLDFYIRRWFRIYPLAFGIIAIAAITRAPISGTPASYFGVAHVSARDFLVQLSLLHQVVPAVLLVPPMWSLTYEVLMYLMLPMLFFFVQKNFSLWPLIVLWLLAILNSYRGDSAHHTFVGSTAYFLPGIMAYVAYGRWRPKLPAWTLAIFLAAIWLAFFYHFNFHRGWIFCLLLGLAMPLFRQFRSKFVLEPSRIIAKYSYGAYLTHPFAIALGFWYLRNNALWLRFSVDAIALVVFPWLSYHLIEHPLRGVGSRLAAKAEKSYEQLEMSHYRRIPAE